MPLNKSKTPSFIHEFLVITTHKDNRILDVRLEAGRHLYNACLVSAVATAIEFFAESRPTIVIEFFMTCFLVCGSVFGLLLHPSITHGDKGQVTFLTVNHYV